MIDDNIYQYASSALYALLQLLIILGCIILVFKTPNMATILMLTGSILSGLMQIITPIIYNNYLNGSDSVSEIIFITSVVSGLFHAIFGVGLLLLALSHKKKQLF